MCKKIYPIAVRFSFEENELIKQQAAEDGVSVSGYIRDKIGLDSPSRKSKCCHKCDAMYPILGLLLIQNASKDDLAKLRINAYDIARLQDYVSETLSHSLKMWVYDVL